MFPSRLLHSSPLVSLAASSKLLPCFVHQCFPFRLCVSCPGWQRRESAGGTYIFIMQRSVLDSRLEANKIPSRRCVPLASHAPLKCITIDVFIRTHVKLNGTPRNRRIYKCDMKKIHLIQLQLIVSPLTLGGHIALINFTRLNLSRREMFV